MAKAAATVVGGSRTLKKPIQVPIPTRAKPKLAIAGGKAVAPTPVPFMSTALSAADIAAATAVLHSGMLRAARKCDELETRFAQMSAARFAMTCANGTCALQLAYEPLLKPGDEVLVPAWSFIATVS